MSGGKGGGQKTEIPDWLKEPVQRTITRGEAMSHKEYTPYAGPTVAAFQPGQLQAMRNTGSAMSAFGMAPAGADASGDWMTAGIAKPTEFADGVRGYSSTGLYDASVAAARGITPAEAEAERIAAAQRNAQIDAGLRADASDVVKPVQDMYANFYGTGEAGQSSTPSAMQKQYQDQQNYERMVDEYTSEEGDTNWDAVNRAYARRYG